MKKVNLFPPPLPKLKKASVALKGAAAKKTAKALFKEQEFADKRYKRTRDMEDIREAQRAAHEYKYVDDQGNPAPEAPQAYRNRIFLRDQLGKTITRR